MRKTRVWIAVGSLIFTGAMFAGAQPKKVETRKAGLWEISTTITWKQSPFIPGSVSGPAKNGTQTRDVCLTQEMIDQYGALLPQSRGNCHIANKVMQLGGMTADWVCQGSITGKGALESTWSDLEHSTGKLHFQGTFQAGGQLKPIEWTTESTATFKSENCGNVQPAPLPKGPAPR